MLQSMKFVFIFFLLFSFVQIFSETPQEVALTISQEDIKTLNKFLNEIARPELSIPQKIEKYKEGFDKVIKKDTAAESIDNFIITFTNFFTLVEQSDKPTITDLQAFLNLYTNMMASDKLTAAQKNKLPKIDSITSKLEVQKLFKAQLLSAANARDFNTKFSKYSDLFFTSLNENINQENRNLWVNGIGQLVTAALDLGKKESDKVKALLNDVLKNKSYEKQRNLLSDEQKKWLNEYAKLLEPKVDEKVAKIAPGAMPKVTPATTKQSVKPVAKNFKNSKILAKK